MMSPRQLNLGVSLLKGSCFIDPEEVVNFLSTVPAGSEYTSYMPTMRIRATLGPEDCLLPFLAVQSFNAQLCSTPYSSL